MRSICSAEPTAVKLHFGPMRQFASGFRSAALRLAMVRTAWLHAAISWLGEQTDICSNPAREDGSSWRDRCELAPVEAEMNDAPQVP